MSANAPTRTQATRLFAHELGVATKTVIFSDDEKAPKFQILPTGGRANRVFIVGTLTAVDDVGSDNEYLRARIVDPNGDPFFVYAGQYQPDCAKFLRAQEPPAYVAVVGKTSTYEGQEGKVYVSIKPESIQEVDEATRDRWVVETAEQTFDRVEAALAGEPAPGEADLDADLFEMAVDAYGSKIVETVHEKATEAVGRLQAEREGDDSADQVKADGGEADDESAQQEQADSDNDEGEQRQERDGGTSADDGDDEGEDGDSDDDSDDDEAVVCEVCGDTFDSEQGLSVHQGMLAKRDGNAHGREEAAPAAD